MPTGRLPIGTSLTNLLSNIRLSFAMLLSSCGPVFGRMFPRPRAQPLKPTLGLRAYAHDDYGDVFGAAAIVRQGHQLLRRLGGVRLGLQCSRNFLLKDHTRQSVVAPQQ